MTPQSYRTHAPISRLTLPAAAGGDPPLSYGVVPTLPAGLTYTRPAAGAGTGGGIAGTPTAAAAATTYTLTATDADGDAATLPFVLTVQARPRFVDVSVVAQRYETGQRVNVRLPEASAGDGATEYAVTPALPAGLGFDAATRRIRGTPTTATAAATYTLIAHDADGDRTAADAVQLTFTVEVTDAQPTFGPASVSAQYYRAGTPVPAWTLPAALGGDGDLTYRLEATPTLPDGLTYTAPAAGAGHGGTIGGTPTAAKAEATYTLRATDTDGDAATLDFTLAVAAADAPTVSRIDFLKNLSGDDVYTAGEDVWLRVRFAGADSFTVTGRPRLKLTIGSHTRLAAFNFMHGADLYMVYGVQRADRDSDGIGIVGNALILNGGTIRKGGSTVDADLDLSATVIGSCDCTVDGGGLAFTARLAPQRLAVGTPVRVTLPAAAGGSGAVTYRLGTTPALPRGLSFDATARVLSGTPTQTRTLTAAAGTDTATLTFLLLVLDPTPRPVFTHPVGT